MRQADDVECCVRQLGSRVERERINAAQALPFFVYQADDQDRTMKAALTALARSLEDDSVKVRRAVAKSLLDLMPDAIKTPRGFLELLAPGLEDSDEVVRTRIAKVLKKSELKGK